MKEIKRGRERERDTRQKQSHTSSIDWNRQMINKKKCEENQIINNAQTHTNPVILCKTHTVSSPFRSQSGITKQTKYKKKATNQKKEEKNNIIYITFAVTSSAIANTQTTCQGTHTHCAIEASETITVTMKIPYSIHLSIFILFVDANGNENKLCKNDMCTGNQEIMRSDRVPKMKYAQYK